MFRSRLLEQAVERQLVVVAGVVGQALGLLCGAAAGCERVKGLRPKGQQAAAGGLIGRRAFRLQLADHEQLLLQPPHSVRNSSQTAIK